jgi:hypothetical protein
MATLLIYHDGNGGAQRGRGCCSTDKGRWRCSIVMAEEADLEEVGGVARSTKDGGATRLP